MDAFGTRIQSYYAVIDENERTVSHPSQKSPDTMQTAKCEVVHTLQ